VTSHDDLEVEESVSALRLQKVRVSKSVGGSGGGSTIVKADFNKDELFFHRQQQQQQQHQQQQGVGSHGNHLSAVVGTDSSPSENVAITLTKVKLIAGPTYYTPS